MSAAEPTNHTTPLPETLTARLHERLAFIYGADRADAIAVRLRNLLEAYLRDSGERPSPRNWDERDVVLITYGDTVQTHSEIPLQTLHNFLTRHVGDAVSTVHILPFFPYSSDDGFSVTDYRSVRSDLGDWPDINAIADDYDLMVDLVLNHCSRESLWFNDFIEERAPGKDYFIEVDPHENLSMVVRPRSTPLLSKVRTRNGMRHVWATFSNDQIDLDFSNPDVLLEFVDILLFYLHNGARIVRLDAVAFLWKEIGTTCIHLPRTHEVVKLLRDSLDAVEPAALLLTETNVPHQENLSYFSDGDEAHMVYQFSLPPLILHGLWLGSARHLTEWTLELQSPPPGCTFLNFTASHDGVGLRPLEGLLPDAQIEELLASMRQRGGYISTRRNRDGRDTPYELNISYFDACRDPADADERLQIARFLLSQTLPLALQGVPAVYLHSLTATPNDHIGVERTGATRAINRRKWDKGELEFLLADANSITSRVFRELLRRLQRRKQQAAFHPDAAQQILNLHPACFTVLRTTETGERLLALHNFSQDSVPLELPDDLGLDPHQSVIDVLTDHPLVTKGKAIILAPYSCHWLPLPGL